MLKLDKHVALGNTGDFIFGQDSRGLAQITSLRSGKVVRHASSTNIGSWQDMEFAPEDIIFLESDVHGIQGDFIDDHEVLIFQKDGETRILCLPDETPTYKFDDPYRLYYTVDSNKLMQNVGDSWVMVGTPDHDNLYNRGKLTHTQLENSIEQLAERVTDFEQGSNLENVATKNDLIEVRELMAGNVAALKDYVDNTTTGTIKTYKGITPDRYDVKTDVSGEYIEIPSTAIPMDDALPIDIITDNSEPINNVKQYTPTHNAENYQNIFIGSGNNVITADPSVRSWLIPTAIIPGTQVKITLSAEATRCRIACYNTVAMPKVGDSGTHIFSNDSSKTTTFSAPDNMKWLLVYCFQGSLTIEYTSGKLSLKVPNWVPSYDKMLARIEALEKRILELQA